MKRYEAAFRFQLPVRMPVVIRLDGKCFHTLTKDCERPFDVTLRDCLVQATRDLMWEIPGRFAYHQSDEVSVLLIDYNKFDTDQWFDGIVQKMVSVAASVMGVQFSRRWGPPGYFDARVFAVPERDIENYFIWRQRDCMKNAVTMAAETVFSTKELHGKHSGEKTTMLAEKGITFDAYPEWFRFGSLITRDKIAASPIFSKNREVLKSFLTVEEE